MQDVRQDALGAHMPDDFIYQAHCPGCGCKITVGTKSKEPIGIGFNLLLTNPQTISEAIGERREQDNLGNQAMGS